MRNRRIDELAASFRFAVTPACSVVVVAVVLGDLSIGPRARLPKCPIDLVLSCRAGPGDDLASAAAESRRFAGFVSQGGQRTRRDTNDYLTNYSQIVTLRSVYDFTRTSANPFCHRVLRDQIAAILIA